MASALTAPFATAALVLCVAGIAKLRSPSGAVGALAAAGLPGGPGAVRAFAVVELALGADCLGAPGPISAGTLAVVYAGFGALSLRLARRRAACGCFGSDDLPATAWQSGLSAVLAVVGVAAALSTPHGIGWLLDRPPAFATTIVVGVVGCAYAAVVAYTELPRAWGAWARR